jgi:twitching motility protein PilT
MNGSAVIEALGELIETCLNDGGSDIHLTADFHPMLRLHGRLEPQKWLRFSAVEISALADGMLNERQQEQYRSTGQVDFGYTDGQGRRFRANLYRGMGKPILALRHLSDHFPTPQELRLPPQVQALSQLKDGLVLVTGATGSGKSTTLAVLINEINCHRHRHIITIEDPVEFVHPNKHSLVHQRELHSDTESFASAVRASLREDPDVIMVGELRDRETVQAAISAAETGHLVLTTLHTNDAVGAIDRLVGFFPGIEQGIARSRIGMCLRAVVAQQLVPVSKGAGRVAALEILLGNPAVANLIAQDKGKQLYSVIESGRSQGMQTLDQALVDLVRERWIGADTALGLARHRPVVERLLAQAGPGGTSYGN